MFSHFGNVFFGNDFGNIFWKSFGNTKLEIDLFFRRVCTCKWGKLSAQLNFWTWFTTPIILSHFCLIFEHATIVALYSQHLMTKIFDFLCCSILPVLFENVFHFNVQSTFVDHSMPKKILWKIDFLKHEFLKIQNFRADF